MVRPNGSTIADEPAAEEFNRGPFIQMRLVAAETARKLRAGSRSYNVGMTGAAHNRALRDAVPRRVSGQRGGGSAGGGGGRAGWRLDWRPCLRARAAGRAGRGRLPRLHQ